MRTWMRFLIFGEDNHARQRVVGWGARSSEIVTDRLRDIFGIPRRDK